jgi:hypothetical protein
LYGEDGLEEGTKYGDKEKMMLNKIL